MDSSGLKYSSIEQLQCSSSISRELTQKLEKMSCDGVYESMTKLIKRAKESRGEVESQYQFYMKAGELASIITKKSDFDKFKREKSKQLLFHKAYDDIVSNLSELQALLSRKYDEQKLRLDKIGRANSIEKNSNESKQFGNSTTRRVRYIISPKDLIRMVEKDEVKKSAIIIDYRQNKSESIYYKNETLITIIQIPFEMVDKSMIFSKMKQGLGIQQRALLQRLPTYDYVVLMEDDTPELSNGIPIVGTKASFIMKALTDYVGSEYRTKEKPMFMDGGFRMWKNQYPTYTTSENNTARSTTTIGDGLDDAIQRFHRENSLSSISYADLIAPKSNLESRKSISPSSESKLEQPIRDTTNLPYTPKTSQQNPLVPQTSSNSTFSRPGFNITPSIPLIPSIPERPGPPIFLGPSNEPILQPSSPGIPLIPSKPQPQPPPLIPDRSVKPIGFNIKSQKLNELEKNINFEERIDQTISVAPRVPPNLDRTTKPSLISKALENGLLTIYDEMLISVKKSGNERRDGFAPGMTGLYNMGNTCFMSATLQCLFQTPSLSELFTRDNFVSKVNPQNKLGTKGLISAVFSAMMDLVWCGQFKAIRPQRFLQIFADKVNSSLADGEQHDASEFQLFLLDALHEDTNQVINRVNFEQNYKGGKRIAQDAANYIAKSRQFSYSKVNKIFSNLTVSELTCSVCSESSATFEENTLISVELSALSSSGNYILDDCLKSHFSTTKLDGDSRWNCPKCKNPQPAIRRTKLWKLPPILVIHLKRFSLENGEYVKNSTPVQFEINHFNTAPWLHNLAPPEQKVTYRLYAVTNHSGRLNSGHYTATASHLEVNRWFKFDDEIVTPTDPSAIDNRAAYILFYKAV